MYCAVLYLIAFCLFLLPTTPPTRVVCSSVLVRWGQATSAAVASARELGETIPAGVSEPVGKDRSARPLVDLLLSDIHGVKQDAVGATYQTSRQSQGLVLVPQTA